MLKRSFIRSTIFIPVIIVFLLFATNVWIPYYLICPIQVSGFSASLEHSFPVLLAALYAFTLPNKFEIELGLVCGVSTAKLALSKVIPVFLYSLFSTFIMLFFYRYMPYDLTQYRIIIPIFVPENFKLYMAISFFVTTLFFSALFFFFRVLTRNCYIPIAISLFAITLLDGFYQNIHNGTADIRLSIIDIFISSYFVGNAVPNAIVEQHPEFSIIRNAWTTNRLIFFALSVLLIAATYLLLRREKLHKGFGD